VCLCVIERVRACVCAHVSINRRLICNVQVETSHVFYAVAPARCEQGSCRSRNLPDREFERLYLVNIGVAHS